MNVSLDRVEARVLGALIEKEITTPEYYPLSLNALVNACNQKSNRDPIMDLDEPSVRSALLALDEKGLARSAVTEGRVPKYEHQLQEAFNFTRPEIAILCELLLRGPQTPGELRSRASRMHAFDDLIAIHSALQRLMKHEPPLVKLLPRQPGTKEARYAQLLSPGEDESPSSTANAPEPEAIAPPGSADERIARLEADIASLRAELAELKGLVSSLQRS